MSSSEDFSEDTELQEVVNPREKPMGFFEHLEDLRWTLIKCAIVFCVFAAGIGFFLKEFNEVLLWPLNHVKESRPDMVLELGTTSVMEGFSVIIQMCTVGGLICGAPFYLFFVGQFVTPALNTKELKLLMPLCIAAGLLFLAGTLFSFFLLVPSTIRVSVELNELFGFAMRWTPAAYYGILIWLVLGVGASFEFPLLLLLAVYLGLVSVERLRKWRRHAVVLFFIVAAIVTPTPDPFTQIMFALPLYCMFEIALIVASRMEKRRATS